MPLLKLPTMTPARLEANRRNAQKSTASRTARGKAQSRMNGLREGWDSRFYLNLVRALLKAPPCAGDETPRANLTPEQAAHPVFAEIIEIARQAEFEVVEELRLERAQAELRKKNSFLPDAKPECY